MTTKLLAAAMVTNRRTGVKSANVPTPQRRRPDAHEHDDNGKENRQTRHRGHSCAQDFAFLDAHLAEP